MSWKTERKFFDPENESIYKNLADKLPGFEIDLTAHHPRLPHDAAGEVKANEGHGFHNEENRFDFYAAMEKFLARHLK